MAPAVQFEFAYRLAAGDTGIVDQDVEPAEPLYCLGDGRCPLFGLCHVEACIMRIVAEFACNRMAFVIEYVSDDDLGPFADQQPRVFGAHAAGTAGDQRDFAVDSSHPLSVREVTA